MRYNRILIGTVMAAAAVVTLVGLAISPFEGDLTGGDYFKSLVEYATQASVGAAVLHTGYLLLGPAAVSVFVLLEGRMRVVGTIGMALAVIGASNLSALVFTDYADLALAQSLPSAQAHAIDNSMVGNLWAIAAWVIPGLAGTYLGMLLVTFAAWRARVAGIWVPITTLAGVVAVIVFGKQAHLVSSVVAMILFVGPIGYLGVRTIVEAARSAAPAVRSTAPAASRAAADA